MLPTADLEQLKPPTNTEDPQDITLLPHHQKSTTVPLNPASNTLVRKPWAVRVFRA